MDITEQISNVIDNLKNQSNSLAKNKTISFLQNARVWSKELPDEIEEPMVSDLPLKLAQPSCICTELGVRKDCLIHGIN